MPNGPRVRAVVPPENGAPPSVSFPGAPTQAGTTAVTSISTSARGSSRRTSTRLMAG